ncbi:hypothetical protein HON36_00505 [Candidatus Parcubacteria bacterium]|jgi:hypothetical protein|nr:hypothetical protein [Candidatus Parcubacteria bacterium]
MIKQGPKCREFIIELGQLKSIKDNLIERMNFFVQGEDKSGNFLTLAKKDGRYLFIGLPRMINRVKEARKKTIIGKKISKALNGMRESYENKAKRLPTI